MNLSSVKAKLCLFVLAVAVLSCAFAPEISAQRKVYSASTSSRVSAAGFDEGEQEIFGLINQERRKKGLDELAWDANLARLAREYSEKMARENFFSHYDRSGEAVEGRARARRIKNWSKIGENLYFCEGYDNPNAMAVRGWMKSPSHRDNILDPDYNVSGIGIAESAGGGIYVTQVFISR
ncbi:MAG TPA: CAP domain-containing protein [Pyrinomonadaceae bacterium]|nr:CAP domain-containing protein [Pyrinomonadaceae bacterium]